MKIKKILCKLIILVLNIIFIESKDRVNAISKKEAALKAYEKYIKKLTKSTVFSIEGLEYYVIIDENIDKIINY